MTRPWTAPERLPNGRTRITVKRCCNGCRRELGDATPAELDAAVAGRDLGDVRAECPDCAPRTVCRGCGGTKKADVLACTDCLAVMPAHLIAAVKTTYDDADLVAHAFAVQDAVAWLNDRRRTPTTTSGGTPWTT